MSAVGQKLTSPSFIFEVGFVPSADDVEAIWMSSRSSYSLALWALAYSRQG